MKTFSFLTMLLSVLFSSPIYGEPEPPEITTVEQILQFEVVIPAHEYGQGQDEKLKFLYQEDEKVSWEALPKNHVVRAGEKFNVRLFRPITKLSQEDFKNFLVLQDAVLVGLELIGANTWKDRPSTQNDAIWKNTNSDWGTPLLGFILEDGCFLRKNTEENFWYLYAGFDLGYNGTDQFLVYTRRE